MDLFGRMRKLDSSLQRGLDNGFARVFGGEVVLAEVDEILKQEAEDALMEDTLGNLFAPSRYAIHLSEHDYNNLLTERPNLANELRDRLYRFLRNEGWGTIEGLSVDVRRDYGLHTGQLKATSQFDSSSESSEGRMSEAPVQSDGGQSLGSSVSGDTGYDRSYSEYNSSDSYGSSESKDSSNYSEYQDSSSYESYGQSYNSSYDDSDFRNPDEDASIHPGTEYFSSSSPHSTPHTVTLYLRDGSDRSYQLRHGANLIGRGNPSDLRLPDTGVSRRHAEIRWDGTDAILTDLESTNGTVVNETPVDNWLLADGDIILMGHSELEVRFT